MVIERNGGVRVICDSGGSSVLLAGVVALGGIVFIV